MRILIITGGRIDESFALSLLQKEKFDHMIVVDGALAFWDKVERNPEIQCHFDHLVGCWLRQKQLVWKALLWIKTTKSVFWKAVIH